MHRLSIAKSGSRSKLTTYVVAAMALAFGLGCLDDPEVAACKKQCPSEWTQVCGENDVSYRNDCHASCAGVSVVHSGAC